MKKKKWNAAYIIVGFGLLRFVIGLIYHYFHKKKSNKESVVEKVEDFWFAPDSQSLKKCDDCSVSLNDLQILKGKFGMIGSGSDKYKYTNDVKDVLQSIENMSKLYDPDFKGCGGSKGCTNREPNDKDYDCKECFADINTAMNYLWKN